jgi:hypothetical protein
MRRQDTLSGFGLLRIGRLRTTRFGVTAQLPDALLRRRNHRAPVFRRDYGGRQN